ncbi:Hypothetical predicted protein, partial [Paramuricea clavata]
MLHNRTDQNTRITYNGITAKTPREKAELFNSYFASVFQTSRLNKSTENDDYDDTPPKTHVELSNITVSVEEVVNNLRNLDVTKAHGPDRIHPRLLKECSEQIGPSLCALFNHSLNCGRVPIEWKAANITPVHKKESKEVAENFRPISLLSIKPIVCDTTSVCFHAIGKSLYKNIQTDILYLDFAKAFDSVDHDILLAKLKSNGVNGNLLNWFTDYLHGRVQRVVVDGVASDWATVTSGVPQGSLLGPILFVIFINDYPNVVSDTSQTALYADDSKLYKSISCLGSCESLQQSLNHLSIWSHNNNIIFNASKCKVLTVTRKSNHLGNTTLVHVRKEKDLGCIIINHLTWDQQVLVVVCKANKMLGLLRRTCPLLTNTKVRRSLYLSLVKCHLDYATQVWSPALTSLKIKIENVQRRATRRILKQRKGPSKEPTKLTASVDRQDETNEDNPPSIQPTRLTTSVDRQDETTKDNPPSKQPTKQTMTVDRQDETTRDNPPSKQPTRLTTLVDRENETTEDNPPSIQPTRLTMSVDRQDETTKDNPPSKQPTRLTTSDDRQNETTEANLLSKQPTRLTTSVARQDETTEDNPPSKFQPTKQTMTVDRQDEKTKDNPPSKQPTRLTTLVDRENETTEGNLPSKQPTKLTTSHDRHHETANRNLNKNIDLQRYVGVIKKDYFIVLVCVLVIGALVVAFIIWNFWHQARRPDTVRPRPTFGAYVLEFSDEDTTLLPSATITTCDQHPPSI